jgi:hypothetical protein
MAPRPLSESEKAILHRLAPHASMAAIDGLRAVARCVCGCHSIGFHRDVKSGTLSGDATADDLDGVTILISFDTDKAETEAYTLELQRADGEGLARLPEPEGLTVLRASRWGAEQEPPTNAQQG